MPRRRNRETAQTLGDDAVRYETVGSGPLSVILMHGLFGSPDNWRAIMEELVLSGSAGLFDRNVTDGKRLRYCRSTIQEQACEIFHDPVHATDELVEDVYSMLEDRQYRRFLLRVSKATRDGNMIKELADLDVPTVIVWGRNDSMTPPFVAEQFRDKITHAELEFIDECGHAPPIEQPKEFARILDAFLGNLTSSRVPT